MLIVPCRLEKISLASFGAVEGPEGDAAWPSASRQNSPGSGGMPCKVTGRG